MRASGLITELRANTIQRGDENQSTLPRIHLSYCGRVEDGWISILIQSTRMLIKFGQSSEIKGELQKGPSILNFNDQTTW